MIDIAAIKERREQAANEIAALCIGRLHDGGRDWRMSIPVQFDDSDVVLTALLRDVDALVAEVERLQQIEEATNRERAQASFYRVLAGRIITAYMKVFPNDAYFDDHAALERITAKALECKEAANAHT